MNKRNLSTHRLFFSNLFFGYMVFSLTDFIVTLLTTRIISNYFPNVLNNMLMVWIISLVPMYVIAFPILYLILCGVKAEKIERKGLAFREYVIYLPISMFLMYVGNIAGNVVSAFFYNITGYETVNIASELIVRSNLIYIIIFAVIIGPVIEELMFRKLLIDRVIKYGELPAVLLSGITFGIFHGNINQLFYAMFLGFIFAYVYVKTGKIGYSISYHMIINFLGSVLPLLLLSGLDDTTKQALFSGDVSQISLTSEVLLTSFFLICYSLAMFSVSIAGVVFLILNRNKVAFKKAEIGLSNKELLSAIVLNFGMMSFILMCIVQYVLNLSR